MNADFLTTIKGFVGLTTLDEEALRHVLPWLEPNLDELAERFYSTIRSHPEASRVFKNEAQVENLKRTLKDWGRRVCTGPYDPSYMTLRSRIGRIHVQIGLPQRYMFTAMSVVRQFFTELVEKHCTNAALRSKLHLAFAKVLDCELAIMLETYAEDLLGKLSRNERLVALGTVAVAVNHELKNPIAVLRTSVDALRRQCDKLLPGEGPESDRIKRHIQKLDRNIDRMHQNISSLLEFARHSELALEERDIHAVLNDAIEEVAPPIAVEILRGFDPALGPIQVDPVQIQRVFVNLARNACEAMSSAGGVLHINTAPIEGGIRISFTDTGPGIPPDMREQVFAPLWTTKPQGTGMGLAICRNIVEAHRGRIWAEAVSAGGKIVVELPRRGEKV